MNGRQFKDNKRDPQKIANQPYRSLKKSKAEKDEKIGQRKKLFQVGFYVHKYIGTSS